MEILQTLQSIARFKHVLVSYHMQKMSRLSSVVFCCELCPRACVERRAYSAVSHPIGHKTEQRCHLGPLACTWTSKSKRIITRIVMSFKYDKVNGI